MWHLPRVLLSSQGDQYISIKHSVLYCRMHGICLILWELKAVNMWSSAVPEMPHKTSRYKETTAIDNS